MYILLGSSYHMKSHIEGIQRSNAVDVQPFGIVHSMFVLHLCPGNALIFARPIATNASGLSSTPALLEGKKLFTQYCAKCHGKNADGEGRMTIRLYRKKFMQLPSNFTTGVFKDRPDEYLRKIINDGGEAHAMSKYMPPFSDELTHDEVNKLIAYIRQTASSHSPAEHIKPGK
ncbi:MAG TPA: c-type cytochrome [Gammaproteobacteria bacterium]|nr:c-type cytochrome [Gammaproteobacteria bacterium]